MIEFENYRIDDTLYLWWLANPQDPRLIGELRMVRALKGVSLSYTPAWLQSGFPLSDDLPLTAGEFSP
jgi:serine/threonine-protein kinase HipA